MPAAHTIVFTIMARGISVDSDPMPVSVFVAPRLTGGKKLGEFPDWLGWTRLLRDKGLLLKIQSHDAANGNLKTTSVKIDRSVLQPELWEALFREDTLVRSHTFDDYSGRGIITYPIRRVLSAVKSIYKRASEAIVLPSGRDQRGSNRNTLSGFLDGVAVHWNGKEAPRKRDIVKSFTEGSIGNGSFGFLPPQSVDDDGAINDGTEKEGFEKMTMPFSVFHHMPTPSRKDHPIEEDLDKDTILDFHQALSSLNSYPQLLRALGLVFDLELPRDFVTETAENVPGRLSVIDAKRAWAMQPVLPAFKTSYIHAVDMGGRSFFTEPRNFSLANFPINVLGLLLMNSRTYGVTQIDVDGAMHKMIMTAETLDTNAMAERNATPDAQVNPADNPEVFDPEATLASLRSAGFSLYLDNRFANVRNIMAQSLSFNDAIVNNNASDTVFQAEDLTRGYRLDVWDSVTDKWHSVNLRTGDYTIGDQLFHVDSEEGFIQLALTQPAKNSEPATDDLYLHEAITRWAGWSLSVPRPSKHLSRYPNSKDAVQKKGDSDPEGKFLENQPDTPFKLTTTFNLPPGTLPRLRFGARYRFRLRAVDLSGNSIGLDEEITKKLIKEFPSAALPNDSDGIPYLRFEPVGAPYVIIRDPKAITGAGSAMERLVIRTFNNDISKDGLAPDTTAGDRHIVPPRSSIEMGEQLGMFDDASGKIDGSKAMWSLIAQRDEGEFKKQKFATAGHDPEEYPLDAGPQINPLPHLPDLFSRGAALRDLPGTENGTLARMGGRTSGTGPAPYKKLSDPNPRPGSAVTVSFGGESGWQQEAGFRLALAEPAPGQTDPKPHWNAIERVLTVFLPKGTSKVVPLSSYLKPEDLPLMGMWKWLSEQIQEMSLSGIESEVPEPGSNVDRIAHILQRTMEGGHWMLTPPRLLNLVHAVQQPLGLPEFTGVDIEHSAVEIVPDKLQRARDRGRTDSNELAPLTAWRYPNSNDALIMGALKIHGASTAKVDLLAAWTDPVDDPALIALTESHHSGTVDELRLPSLNEDFLYAPGIEIRQTGYYDTEHDQIIFARKNDLLGDGNNLFEFTAHAAPRHMLNDTKHHLVSYSAVATSRYQDYFEPDPNTDFTRTGLPVIVDIPASARPLAPEIVYVVPTFGWERQTDSNVKRSIRFGGGLRVYLKRPWFSSGEGELLGVALWSVENPVLDSATRDKFKSFITQWGMDPIWETDLLYGTPSVYNFPDAVAHDLSVTLEEPSASFGSNMPGRVDVVGFPVKFDETRGLWFADITIETQTRTYMPFIRLALVRYQPHALEDAMISRVAVADFAQLPQGRTALITVDPHHPRNVKVTVSGVTPRGPQLPLGSTNSSLSAPTVFAVEVQQKDHNVTSDLAWNSVPASVARVDALPVNPAVNTPDVMLWSGTVVFDQEPDLKNFRLLITETEYISSENFGGSVGPAGILPGQGRIVYSEIANLDVSALMLTDALRNSGF